MIFSTTPRVGVALSGGSVLGMAHLGVLQAFQDHNVKVDCITGTSAGSLAAALFAFNVSIEEMLEEAGTLGWRAISNFSPSRLGLISNDALGKRVRAFIGDKNIEDASIPLALIATDIHTGEPVVLREGNVAQAVMASAAIPAMYNPVMIDGRMLVDGGLTQNLPLAPLKDMGADVTIGVNVLHGKGVYAYPTGYLDIVFNTFSILMHRANMLTGKDADVLIEPKLEKYTTSDFSKTSFIIAEGYRAGEKAIPAIEEAVATERSWWKRTRKRIIGIS